MPLSIHKAINKQTTAYHRKIKRIKLALSTMEEMKRTVEHPIEVNYIYGATLKKINKIIKE